MLRGGFAQNLSLFETRLAEMTQAELAKRAGVSLATINRIEEQGHADSVTFETVKRLAKALNVDADVLVAFEK